MSRIRNIIAGSLVYAAACAALWRLAPGYCLLGCLALSPFLVIVVLLNLFSEEPAYLYPDELSSSAAEKSRRPSRQTLWLNGSWQMKGPGARQWISFSVPGAFPLAEIGSNFLGRCRFARDFELPQEWGGQPVRLVLPPMCGRAAVSLNGRALGEVSSPELGWSVQADEFLEPGERNRLEIVCRYDGLKPFFQELKNGEKLYGGLFGEARLEILPPYRIAALDAAGQMGPGKTGTLKTAISFEGKYEPGLACRLWLFGPDGERLKEALEPIDEAQFATGASFRMELSDVAAWMSGVPSVYRLEARLEGAASEDRLDAIAGFRMAGDSPGKSRGSRVGVAWAGFAPKFHRAMPAWLIRRDVKLIRDSGLSAVFFNRPWEAPEAAEACAAEGLEYFVRLDRSLMANGRKPAPEEEARVRAWIGRIGSNPAFGGWHYEGASEAENSPWREELERFGKIYCGDLLQVEDFDLGNKGGEPEAVHEAVERLFAPEAKGRMTMLRVFDGSFRKCPPKIRERRNGRLISMIFSRIQKTPGALVCAGSMISQNIYPGFFDARRKEKAALKVVQSYMAGRTESVVEWPQWRPSRTMAGCAAFLGAAELAFLAFQPFVKELPLFYPQYLSSFFNLPIVVLMKILSGLVVCMSLYHFCEDNLLRLAGWQAKFEGLLNSVFLDWQINDKTRFGLHFYAYFLAWGMTAVVLSAAMGIPIERILLETGLTAPWEIFALTLLLPGARWRIFTAGIIFLKASILSHFYGIRGAALWAAVYSASLAWPVICAVISSFFIRVRKNI